jgi:DNA replication protein DnaC
MVDSFAQVDWLFLDDLGAEKATSWAITTLFLIIDRRIREMLPTVVTTNLTPEQIEEQLGPRVASRLSGMYCAYIDLPDYRKQKAVGLR